jgi:hypothetical protein
MTAMATSTNGTPKIRAEVQVRLALVSLLLVLCTLGCQHVVTVTSNVEGARVRVDGVDLGPVPAQFAERSGVGQVHDVEVTAPGFATERRLLRQSESAPGVALPLLTGGTCTVCLAPAAGVAALFTIPVGGEVWGFPVELAGSFGVCVGTLGLGAALVGWAGMYSQQLPEELHFDLVPADAGGRPRPRRPTLTPAKTLQPTLVSPLVAPSPAPLPSPPSLPPASAP